VEPKLSSGRPIVQVLDGLNHPTGLAIQPETSILYVADSGNRQVIRVSGDKAEPVITEFPSGNSITDGANPASLSPGGPLSLLFLNRETLLVGCGAGVDGVASLRVYSLPADNAPIKADAAKTTLTLPTIESASPTGDFYALATSANSIYATCIGGPSESWIASGTRNDLDVSALDRFINTLASVGVGNPAGATISPHGYLVVGQAGQSNAATDSLLVFYDTSTKQPLLKLPTGLYDVSSVAYSARKHLYVLDRAKANSAEAGLFRVLADKTGTTGMRADRVAWLPGPTAMVFDGEGALIVAVVGDGSSGQGKILKIPAEESL
jgi:DNA-binding beta-propeller fold protein YncE